HSIHIFLAADNVRRHDDQQLHTLFALAPVPERRPDIRQIAESWDLILFFLVAIRDQSTDHDGLAVHGGDCRLDLLDIEYLANVAVAEIDHRPLTRHFREHSHQNLAVRRDLWRHLEQHSHLAAINILRHDAGPGNTARREERHVLTNAHGRGLVIE